MRLLMISPVPIMPTNTGGLVRIWQIARGLAHHHHVTLIAPVYCAVDLKQVGLVREETAIFKQSPLDSSSSDVGDEVTLPEASALTYLPIHCESPTIWKQIRSLTSQWPYHTALRYRSQLAQQIQHQLQTQQYDLIYSHFIQPLPYLEKNNCPIVVDQQNVDRIYWARQQQNSNRNLAQRWVAKRNLQKTIRYESARLSQIKGMISVSEADREETRRYAAGFIPHFFVAPNGADFTQFWPRDTESPPHQLVLGFFGSMDLQLNQDAASILMHKILPAVQQRLPALEVSALIIGRNPPHKLVKFAQRHPECRVHFTGTVDEVTPYLHCVDIMVLPLQDGAGTKLRVLETMAAGVCVAGTPLAFVGLDAIQPGTHAICADTPEQLVNEICGLARQPERRHLMSSAAHDVVTQQYGWQQITEQLAAELAYAFDKGVAQ